MKITKNEPVMVGSIIVGLILSALIALAQANWFSTNFPGSEPIEQAILLIGPILATGAGGLAIRRYTSPAWKVDMYRDRLREQQQSS